MRYTILRRGTGLRAAVLATLVFAAFGGERGLAQEKIDRRLALDPDAYVKVFTLAGEVVVEGWDRDSIAVSGSVERGRFDMGAAGSSAKMFVSPDDEADPGAARLTVRLPRRATVWVKTQSASVDVRGVSGTVDVYSVTGDVRVSGELRQLYAESMGGDIDIEVVAGSVRAKNAGGSIIFTGEARDLSLATVSGGISVMAPPVDRGRFETVTGDIEFDGGVSRGGSIGFLTHSGAVRLRLSPGLSAGLSVSTIEGSILNELSPRQPTRGNTLVFDVGDGGSDITVESFSGTVLLAGGS